MVFHSDFPDESQDDDAIKFICKSKSISKRTKWVKDDYTWELRFRAINSDCKIKLFLCEELAKPYEVGEVYELSLTPETE